MGAVRLSYSTFGLTQLDFPDALDAIHRAGYEGVEISFHRRQLNPFDLDDAFLAQIRRQLDRLGLVPACVATASHFFTPSRPHEPSLMALEPAARKRRIDLIGRGIHVARALGAPLVTFGSGFLRDDHVAHPEIDPHALLTDAIHECLALLRDDDDITLLIEPEPGMHIETLDEGLALLNEVGSDRFALHIDLCHAYCSDHDYLDALARAAPFARYLHLSDARAGYNLKFIQDTGARLVPDPARHATLVHFPDTADYLLLDRARPVHFPDAPVTAARQARIAALMADAGIHTPWSTVPYGELYAGRSALDDEIFTYLISAPGLSYDVLERARPVIGWLRGAQGPARVPLRVANTRTGIVHFHDIPGEGTLDFAGSFKALADHGFSGFGAVELYHHIACWEKALTDSHRHLSSFI